MRTKTLLLAAALSAAGLATSLAQSNVYSLNVVGYYNIPLTNNFNYISIQLGPDQTGTNATLTSALGTNWPNFTKVYAYDLQLGLIGQAQVIAGAWTANATVTKRGVVAGGGLVLQPAAGSPTTLTIVGEVLQGHLVNGEAASAVPYLKSSMVPQAGLVKDVLGLNLPTIPGTQNLYRSPAGSFINHVFLAGTWLGGQPNINVGESFFVSGVTNGFTWTRDFTVQ